MNKIVITLEEKDLIILQEIILDENKEEAFKFLSKRIAMQIPEKGSASCDSSRNNPYLLKKKD